MSSHANKNIGRLAGLLAMVAVLLFPLAASAAQDKTVRAPARPPAPAKPHLNVLREAEAWGAWDENRIKDFSGEVGGIRLDRFLIKPELHQASGLPGGESAVASAEYYFGDALQSVHQVTNAAGVVTGTNFSDAWGNKIDLGIAPPSGPGSRYGYTNRERDGESGLMHYRARSYDPFAGRFASRDKVRNSNRYVYAENSPPNFRDPSGLDIGFVERTSQADQDRITRVLFRIEDLAYDNRKTAAQYAWIGLMYKYLRETKDFTIILSVDDAEIARMNDIRGATDQIAAFSIGAERERTDDEKEAWKKMKKDDRAENPRADPSKPAYLDIVESIRTKKQSKTILPSLPKLQQEAVLRNALLKARKVTRPDGTPRTIDEDDILALYLTHEFLHSFFAARAAIGTPTTDMRKHDVAGLFDGLKGKEWKVIKDGTAVTGKANFTPADYNDSMGYESFMPLLTGENVGFFTHADPDSRLDYRSFTYFLEDNYDKFHKR